MKTANPSIGVIRAQIKAIRDKAPHATTFGIFTQGRWAGPDLNGDGENCVAVYQCDSPLQMRLVLQQSPAKANATVLVTPLGQSKISDDILMRLAQRRLHPLNSWEIVRQLFRARQLDPRVTRHVFLADLLLEHAGSRSFPPAAGGFVDAESVWSILLEERLGLSGPYPDLVEILRATVESNLANRWQTNSQEFRTAATQWIGEYGGDASLAVLSCVTEEHGDKALAIGLVMGVVYDVGVGHDLDKAVGRLEAISGCNDLSSEDARRWYAAASDCLAMLPREEQRQCQDDAEAILRSIGAEAHAWRSSQLTSGLEHRLARLGKAFSFHVTSEAKKFSKELLDAYDAVKSHRKARPQDRRIVRVEMAFRLARWLADQKEKSTSLPHSLEIAAQRYAAEGAFVDWARNVLRGGEANKELAAGYMQLLEGVSEIREAENRHFARLLQKEAGGLLDGGILVPVENIVERVVAKVSKFSPVLVLLLDGMSCAVFREISADVLENDWIEVGFDIKQRYLGLSAIPSVTEVSRTSLFCGSLRRGQASDEIAGFASHPALLKVSKQTASPRLFHKASLEDTEDTSLSAEVRKAIADKKLRVVGVVVNAVDDYLDKGDQIDVAWTIQQIRVLAPILAEARSAERIVILLSDHGHICERQTEPRPGEDGVRWRNASAPAGDGELEITSERVKVAEDGKIVVPWTEKIRYGTRKNGYHGGVTPQEMVIPIGLFCGGVRLPEGFEALPIDLPSWWTEPAGPQVDVIKEEPSVEKPRKEVSLPLFAKATETKEAVAGVRWVEDIFTSEMFERQKKMAGRVRITDEQIKSVLIALTSRGGTMTETALASQLGLPAHRLSGLLAMLQRIINVDGYLILDRKESSDTVVLNDKLLKKQFELED